MTTYIQRELRFAVTEAMKTMPIIAITGMRQTGKTTFLKNDQIFKDYRYVSLDDFATLQTAIHQPDELLTSNDGICIDEAQKAPQLLTAVKLAVDKDRTPGKIVLSGSANFALLKGISESLAGRAVYLTLHPFSRREMSGTIHHEPQLVRVLKNGGGTSNVDGNSVDANDILRGGIPPVRGLPLPDASLWFRGFEQTYIERDIRDLARIDDLLAFRTVIKLAALRSGQILNFSQLARDAKLSVATLTRYLQLAEATFVFLRLVPFLRNRSSRLIKSPKIYVADSGFASYLADVDDLGTDNNEPLRGVLFETYALQNISSILESHLPDARISYWHVQGRHEVDFIIEHRKSCVAIELKASTRWSDGDLTSLKVFLERTPSCVIGILAYNGTQAAKLGKSLWAMPLGYLLS